MPREQWKTDTQGDATRTRVVEDLADKLPEPKEGGWGTVKEWLIFGMKYGGIAAASAGVIGMLTASSPIISGVAVVGGLGTALNGYIWGHVEESKNKGPTLTEAPTVRPPDYDRLYQDLKRGGFRGAV